MENKIIGQTHTFNEPIFYEDGKDHLNHAEQKLSGWTTPETKQVIEHRQTIDQNDGFFDIVFKINLSQLIAVVSLLDIKLTSHFKVEMDLSKPNTDFIVSLFETSLKQMMEYHEKVIKNTYLEEYPLEYPEQNVIEFRTKYLVSNN